MKYSYIYFAQWSRPCDDELSSNDWFSGLLILTLSRASIYDLSSSFGKLLVHFSFLVFVISSLVACLPVYVRLIISDLNFVCSRLSKGSSLCLGILLRVGRSWDTLLLFRLFCVIPGIPFCGMFMNPFLLFASVSLLSFTYSLLCESVCCRSQSVWGEF